MVEDAISLNTGADTRRPGPQGADPRRELRRALRRRTGPEIPLERAS